MPRASAALTVLAALLSAGCVLAPAPNEPSGPRTPAEQVAAVPTPPASTTPPLQPPSDGEGGGDGTTTATPGGGEASSPAPAPASGTSTPPSPPSRPPPIGGYAPEDDEAASSGAPRVRFSAGADAGPDRLSGTVPAYAIAADGSGLEARVVAVREARVTIDSLFRVENADASARSATLRASVENATGVESATLELWDAATADVLYALDLLSASPQLDVTLAAGALIEGRYAIAVGGEGGEGFRVAFTLSGTA